MDKQNSTCGIGFFLMLQTVLAVGPVMAADLIVNAGDDPVTLSAAATYDRMFINGDVTIAANTAISATSLAVASNMTGEATLTLAEGATLNVTGTDDVIFGANGGSALVVLHDGAQFKSAKNVIGAYEPAVTAQHSTFDLILSNATFTVGDMIKFVEENETLSAGSTAGR